MGDDSWSGSDRAQRTDERDDPRSVRRGRSTATRADPSHPMQSQLTNGDGYGDGDGHGDGYGDGYGHGYGDGDGHDGYGYGYGDGDGHGYGDGYGNAVVPLS